MRRILLIVAIVIVLLGIGAFVYFYFFANSASITVAPTGNTELPIVEQGIEITGTTIPMVTDTPTLVTARLVKISAGPIVAGEVVVNVPAENASSSPEVAVHYIERQSGNVFTYSTNTKTITRTSNKTILGIQSAKWLPDASFAFVRYLSGADFSTVNTYALPSTSESKSNGFFLPQNLSDIAVSSTSIIALSSGVNGSAASLERIDGTHITELFTTPLSSLRVSFAGKNQYLAFTKPSALIPGSAFIVDSSKNFSRIAGPLNGLVALTSPSGKLVLISYTQNNTMQMQLVNVSTREVVPLPVATIADKCVWASDDAVIYCGIPIDPPSDTLYPDYWYQGAVQFSDRIWKIDVSGRFAQLVLDFSNEIKAPLDAEELAIDPLNTELVFINKNDGSLWAYAL
ncbi:MAG: hypothetical protein V1711_00515 [bacterium]